MQPIAVIDFETTGLSPAMGDRATEIAIAVLEGDRVVDRFQSLMNAGVRISSFIEDYTGISNDMIRGAPPAAEVMAQAARFVRDLPLVAHNASFGAHRAMADAETAAALLARIQSDLQRQYEVEHAPHDLLVKLQRCQRKALPKAIAGYFEGLRRAACEATGEGTA